MSQGHCKAWGQRFRLSTLSHKTGIMKNREKGHEGRLILLGFHRDAMVKIWLTVMMRALFLSLYFPQGPLRPSHLYCHYLQEHLSSPPPCSYTPKVGRLQRHYSSLQLQLYNQNLRETLKTSTKLLSDQVDRFNIHIYFSGANQ